MAKTRKKINLHQLDAELNANGLNGSYKDGEWEITAVNEEITENQLSAAIDAHIAQEEPLPSVEQKLASVGLNLDDLKAVLGL